MPLRLPFGVLNYITHFTELAIKKIEDLAETIEEHNMDGHILPEHLIEDINCLTSHLQTFRPDDNIPIFLGPGMEVQQIISNNLEVAWYLSACLYFHNRINHIFVDDTSIPVDAILMCLLHAEELKALVAPEVMHRDPPITFPAFVGPCNSKDCQLWASLWRSLQKYDLPNVTAQWTAVQDIWNLIDETREEGKEDLSWVDVMRRPDGLSLRHFFERRGFY